MSPFRRSNTKGSARTQVGIKEVRDNVLVLPGNRYRSVLEAGSVNFELQSEAEQDALVDGYQSFLNSLTSPVQILVRTRELDVDRYLEGFRSSREDEPLEIYRKQLDNYGAFIRKLVAGNKILSRKFYVIIPCDGQAGADFAQAKEQIMLEQEILIKGLEKLGMTARPLSGLEILDLFYSFYRPDSAKTQPLSEAILSQTHETACI